jgi:hypothetical protein
MLVLMAGLFVVLAGVLLKNYTKWSQDDGRRKDLPALATKPATSPSPPASIPAFDTIPREAGFTQRNLEYGGNLAPILEHEGGEIGMDDRMFRVARDVMTASPEKFARISFQLPTAKDLFADPETYCGVVFTLRFLPVAVIDYTNTVPERVTSWRIYGTMQRNNDEGVVLESLEPPPTRDWILKRDVIEVDALYLRNATYISERGKPLRAPYLLVKNYRRLGEQSGDSLPGIGQLLNSKFGPMIAGTVLILVLLTVWTIRRHSRQTDKREREHFYTMLRARKKKPST